MRWSFLFIVSGMLLSNSGAAEPQVRPNVVFLIADDLGWADVSFHQGKIKTPRIDELAARGIRLEQFYAEPVCSPSRAGLLTGFYPRRFGITTPLSAVSKAGLPAGTTTIAAELRDRGYETAIVGKWHVGHSSPSQFPRQHGFTHQYGMHTGEIDYYKHVVPKSRQPDWFRDDEPLQEEGYSTDLITRESIRIIREHKDEKPLFLYVAYNAPHAPRQVPEDYAAPYADFAPNRRLFAGQVAALDEGIGKILAAIHDRGWDDNTLVIFLSDNGGPNPGRVADNGPLRGGKGSVFEGGVRVPCAVVWPNHLAVGATWNGLMHVTDWLPTLLHVVGQPLAATDQRDGVDVWNALQHLSDSPRHEVVHTMGSASEALRSGDWKLIRNGGKAARDDEGEGASKSGDIAKPDEWALFNIAADAEEKNDLSASEPATVKRLQARLREITVGLRSLGPDTPSK